MEIKKEYTDDGVKYSAFVSADEFAEEMGGVFAVKVLNDLGIKVVGLKPNEKDYITEGVGILESGKEIPVFISNSCFSIISKDFVDGISVHVWKKISIKDTAGVGVLLYSDILKT